MTTSTKRPKYLNLIKIRLPITGMVSIAHRITGALLFLALPFLVYFLHLSAASEDGFHRALAYMGHPVAKIILLVLAWSVFHHFFAGIRYLLLDADIGVEKPMARSSAFVVLILGVASTLLLMWVLW